ncbi:MAG: phosphotransferase [Gammaproteobacteria bacterium]|nr:phosphotransferase [Gammaproteobacteria bacterium]
MMQNIAEDLKKLEKFYFNKPIKEDAVQLLSGGFSFARNYRIEDASRAYLARFMSTEQPLPNREKECLITEYVGNIDVGPNMYYQNPQQGIIVAEFIEGSTANYSDMVNAPNRDYIVGNVKKLHQATQLEFPRANTLAARIQRTMKLAGSAILQQQLQTLGLIESLNRLFKCEEKHATDVLIHGDLNPNNILVHADRVYFIDWTDAGIGDPFTDISWHALFYPLSFHDAFLRYYFDCFDAFARQKLLCYYCLRLFLIAVWGVGEAIKISEDCGLLLIDIMKQTVFSKPYDMMVGMFTNKITLARSDDFLMLSATMLHFLSQFTKTNVFLAAVEELSRHA